MTEGFSIPIATEAWLLPDRARLARSASRSRRVLAILAAVLGFVALDRTRYGRQVVAIGANMEAARRAGMPVRQRLVLVYIV